ALLWVRELPFEQFPAISKFSIGSQNSGRLIAGMHHAILAARIAAMAIFFPWSFFNQILESRVMRVGHEITGTFPPSRIKGRFAGKSSYWCKRESRLASRPGCPRWLL